MHHIRIVASALGIALASAAPAAAAGAGVGSTGAYEIILINSLSVAVDQSALPPRGATKAILVVDGRAYEIKQVGDNKWVTTASPQPHLKGAKQVAFLDKDTHGIIKINNTPLAVKGALPPPGVTKGTINFGGKDVEIYAAGGGAWKTKDGNLPAPGSTTGIITNWFPTEMIKTAPGPGGTKGFEIKGKPGAADDLPSAPKGSSLPEDHKARRGLPYIENPQTDKARAGTPGGPTTPATPRTQTR